MRSRPVPPAAPVAHAAGVAASPAVPRTRRNRRLGALAETFALLARITSAAQAATNDPQQTRLYVARRRDVCERVIATKARDARGIAAKLQVWLDHQRLARHPDIALPMAEHIAAVPLADMPPLLRLWIEHKQARGCGPANRAVRLAQSILADLERILA